MRSYGPVILLGETPIPADADLQALGLKRNSIEEVAANLSKFQSEGDYQKMFKKELNLYMETYID